MVFKNSGRICLALDHSSIMQENNVTAYIKNYIELGCTDEKISIDVIINENSAISSYDVE
jgi:hypothetical protein